MGDLLDVYIEEERKAPPFISVPVNPEMKPFLVSSSKSLVWTERIEGGEVWSVSRPLGDNIQADIVAAITEKSYEEQWGNLFHLDEKGVNNSIDYLRRCGFQDIDVLINPYLGLESIDEENVEIFQTEWMPLACALFVPKQREYVGNMILFQNKELCCVCVHNSKFGMAIAVEI